MKKKEFQTSSVLAISVAHFIHDIYTSFLAPVLPLLIKKFSLTYSAAGFLSIVTRIPSLLNPVIGYAADKISIKYMLIISPLVSTVFMSLIGLAPSYIILAIMLFIVGFGSAMFHVPAPVMVKNVSGARTGKGMSFFMLGGELSRSIGPLVIMSAISLWGFEGTFRLIPVGVLASVILFFKFRKIETEGTKRQKTKSSAKKEIKQFIPFLTTISGVLFFRAILKNALTTFLPIYITSKGESIWLAGISLSILQIAGAGGTFLSGSISDKLGRKKTLYFVAILLPILMVLFLNSNSFFRFPLLVLLGLILFAAEPVLLAFVNEQKNNNPALLNGVYMGINFIIGAIAVFVVGILSDLFSLQTTYIIATILTLFLLPLIKKIPDSACKAK